MVMNECSHAFETFPPSPKCPCLGCTHSSIKVWPKILFPASTAAVLFGRCLALSPWFLSVLNSSFLSSSLLQWTFKFIFLSISLLVLLHYRCIVDLCKMLLLGIITVAARSFPTWLSIISITRAIFHVPLGDESFTWIMSPILGSFTVCTRGFFWAIGFLI